MNSSAQTGTPSLSFDLLVKLDNTVVSLLAKDQVRREVVCTLAIEAMKAIIVMEAMNAVSAALDPVARSHIYRYAAKISSILDRILIFMARLTRFKLLIVA